jgi:hypothetical protein
MPVYDKWFCKHKNLRVEDKTILPSPWEIMSQDERNRENILPWMFRQTVLITYICRDCGKIIKVKESPDLGP